MPYFKQMVGSKGGRDSTVTQHNKWLPHFRKYLNRERDQQRNFPSLWQRLTDRVHCPPRTCTYTVRDIYQHWPHLNCGLVLRPGLQGPGRK